VKGRVGLMEDEREMREDGFLKIDGMRPYVRTYCTNSTDPIHNKLNHRVMMSTTTRVVRSRSSNTTPAGFCLRLLLVG
jgi:hypothetical protein